MGLLQVLVIPSFFLVVPLPSIVPARGIVNAINSRTSKSHTQNLCILKGVSGSAHTSAGSTGLLYLGPNPGQYALQRTP